MHLCISRRSKDCSSKYRPSAATEAMSPETSREAGAAESKMKNNVEETLQTKQLTQYFLNKEDLETVLRTLVLEIIEKYEVEKSEPKLTVKQVSNRLHVDPSTLWRWERDGYLKPIRIGRKVLYRESEVAVIEEGR